MDTSPAYRTQAIRELIHRIENSEEIKSHDPISPSGGSTFIPIGRIEKYFQEGGEERFWRASKLLRAVFDPEGSGTHEIPVSPRDLAERCCRGFCILVLAGRPDLIQEFTEYDTLRDSRLPFDEQPRDFPRDPTDEGLWGRFNDHQWKFFSPKLDGSSHIRIHRSKVLPFLECGRIAGSAIATVHHVSVHPEHDGLAPAGSSHLYAIKTFRRHNAESSYERESKAFRNITGGGTRTRPGLIGFYGGFEYKETFNIVMEFADRGNLEDFFKTDDRPPTGEDILALWTNVLETVKGLVHVHEQHLSSEHQPHGKGGGSLLQGWHQDLKPSNILVIQNRTGSGYKYFFKVADFGLAHFKTVMEKGCDAADLNTFGTQTYGAPECYSESSFGQFHHLYVKRSTDIWSLGCIFGQVCTWIVKGNAGIQEFSDKRKQATDSLSNFRDSDCFHDGEKVLDQVSTWLKDLRPDLHGLDFATGKVINRMVKEMLQKDPNKRPSANQLQGKAEILLEEAATDLNDAKLRDSMSQIGMSPHPQSPPSSPPHSPHRQSPESITAIQSSPPPRWNMGSEPGVLYSTPQASGSNHLHRTEVRNSAPSVVPRNTGHLAGETGRDVDPSSTPRVHISTRQRRSVASSDGASQPSSPARNGVRPDSFRPVSAGPLSHWGPPAFLSYSDAYQWYLEMKRKDSDKSILLPHHELTSELSGRDHVIIIDNSESMRRVKSAKFSKDHPNLQDLVRLLAYIVKRYDPDGIDLRFMGSEQKLEKCKETRYINQLIEGTPFKGMTNVIWCLERYLQEYIDRIDDHLQRRPQGFLRRPAEKPRPRTYYIFTDGVWQRDPENYGKEVIMRLVDKLSEARMARSQVGIQFIGFGNDVDGLKRLDALDRLNKTESLKLDIVDTEPFDGDIWKMLLGAINPTFDGDFTEVSPVTTSSG